MVDTRFTGHEQVGTAAAADSKPVNIGGAGRFCGEGNLGGPGNEVSDMDIRVVGLGMKGDSRRS